MKITIVYKEESTHRRDIEYFYDGLLRDNPSRKDDIQLLESRTRAAQRAMQMYDNFQYPAIFATAIHDGSIVRSWVGENIPRVADVSYYLNS